MRTRLLVGALVLALVGATVFAVWPVVGGAPWLGNEESAALSPTPRYTPEEAIALVRIALDHEGTCAGVRGAPHERWAATFDPGRHSWLVAAGCHPEEGPPLDFIAGGWLHRWRLDEDSGQVVPYTEGAVDFMRPRRD